MGTWVRAVSALLRLEEGGEAPVYQSAQAEGWSGTEDAAGRVDQ